MRVACMQVALHAPIAGMAGLALGLDFSKKLLQYATTALWHTAKVPLGFSLRAAHGDALGVELLAVAVMLMTAAGITRARTCGHRG